MSWTVTTIIFLSLYSIIKRCHKVLISSDTEHQFTFIIMCAPFSYFIKFFVCVSLHYVCVCVRAHTCMHGCGESKCICMCRPVIDLWMSSSMALLPYFLRQDFLLNLKFTYSAWVTVLWAPGSICLYSLPSGLWLHTCATMSIAFYVAQ